MTGSSLSVLRPRRLCPGDLIGLVAPASPVADPSRIEEGVRYLEKTGYRVRIGSHARLEYGYLAGSDQDRVADLQAMAADSEVKAIFCLRGGYGTTRLLPLLDFKLFRQHPKIIAGFSDITALQLALWKHCRLVTFHGPMVAVDFGGPVDAVTEQAFWDMVTGADAPQAIPLADPATFTTLTGGHAEGMLLGGNLSLLAALTGTPYMPDFSDSILIIEEVGEEPYRVDRMLTQLAQAGVFSGIRGIVAGQFSDCTPKDLTRPSLSVEELFRDLARTTGVPFVAGCRFGHVTTKLTLPIGHTAALDAETGMLMISGPGVD